MFRAMAPPLAQGVPSASPALNGAAKEARPGVATAFDDNKHLGCCARSASGMEPASLVATAALGDVGADEG